MAALRGSTIWPSYQYEPLSTSFAAAREGGMTSTLFDIEANMRDGDTRALDAAEVQRIMADQGVSFDDARLIRHHLALKRNGAAEDGTPLDPRAVTRL